MKANAIDATDCPLSCRPSFRLCTDLRICLGICLCLCLWLLAPAPVRAASVAERNGFVLAPPNLYTKQIFRVRAEDRPLIEMINAASNSIAAFIVERNNLVFNPEATKLPHVLPQAAMQMRLPPPTRANPQRRYIAVSVYGWRKIDENRLEFRIDYADPGAPADRYTDSYVFVRRGPGWFFEQHGRTPPRSWRLPAPRDELYG